MKLVPLGDRLVIKQVVAEPQEATVEALGSDVKADIKEGDTVVYSKYAGTTVTVEEEEYIIVKEEDVLAVLK